MTEPIEVFTERAKVRAFLWAIGEYELHEALDKLQHDAATTGLIDRYGADKVQSILAGAFARYREIEEPPAADAAPQKRSTPQTAIEAVMYCVRERGLAALKEPANIERLSRCDAQARAQINKRIAARFEKDQPSAA